MKLISRLLMLVATFGAIILTDSTSNTRGNSFVTTATKSQLQLTTNVLETRSCSPSHFGLKLRLTLRNVGEEPLILHKQTIISRIMVSANLASASAKQYEQDQRSDDPGADIGLDSPLESDFTILKPGDVIEREEQVSLYLFNEKRTAERLLGEGTHYLQVDVGCWPYIAEAGPFRKKWRGKGYLWFQGITSEPMSFTINRDRPQTKCS